jgi:predicted nuclease with TOPRIM domain
MNQPDIFGPDLDEAGVSYQSIAAQIKALKPRNLSQGSLEDVLTMIEWMQQEVSKRDELLTRRGNELEELRAKLDAWENGLRVRQRTVEAVLKAGSAKRSGWFVRRG